MGWQSLRRRPGFITGALLVGAAALLALSGVPWGASDGSLLTHLFGLYPPDYQDPSVSPIPSLPDGDHLLGTDAKGRDVLSLLLHGARISVAVGLSAEAVALACGLLVGLAAGTLGGKVDALLMRTTDVLMALPLPLLAMAVLVLFQQRSIVLVFTILGLFSWGAIARLVRGEILSLKRREFAEAARALGAGGGRLALRHLLPHAMVPALVVATVGVAGNILTEAWLSFLSISASTDAPSWGRMIYEARVYLGSHPRLSLLPGLALTATVGGYFLLADELRRALDPGLRERIWTGH